MWIEEYATNLTFLIRPKLLGSYLTTQTRTNIQGKVAELRSIAGDVRRARKPQVWAFSIPRDYPIQFIENHNRFQVDISGTIKGNGDSIEEVGSLLRVWSLNKNICYRARIDAQEVETLFDKTKRRVIIRFHFDRREKEVTSPEPIYHMQVGGVAHADENCWFPNLEVPRLQFPPMDVILLSELVLVNFFHEDSRDLREKPEWKSLVIKSQEAFQHPYFDSFNSFVKSDTDTILGKLISVSL